MSSDTLNRIARHVSEPRLLIGCDEPRRSDEYRRTEIQATNLLESHPHFRGRSRWIKCRCLNRNLTLSGILPSFYLKQLAQELLRKLDVEQIVNRIVVASPAGEINRLVNQPWAKINSAIGKPR